MTVERKGFMQFKGNPITIVGADIQVGQTAPEFTAQTMDWTMVKGLESTAGKVRIIGALPSLSTSVCDRETRRFNEEAASLSEDIVILAVSNDLPYAIKNWCGMTGVDRVTVLSDHLETEFGKKYGALMKEPRILRRAVFVVGRDDKVVYAAYMPEIGIEPDYPAVLEAARQALVGG